MDYLVKAKIGGIKFFILAFFSSVVFLATSVESNAETYNSSDLEEFSDWFSLKLHLGGDAAYRAGTIASDGTVLAFDFVPSDCGGYLHSMVMSGDEIFSEDKTVEGPDVVIRVDNNEFIYADSTYSIERGDESVYIYMKIRNSDQMRLINEIKNGVWIRYKINYDEPSYMRFSLRGSLKAITRSQALCQESDQGVENYFDDEQYF